MSANYRTTCPCQFGPCGHCADGNHKRCAFLRPGWTEHSHQSPDGHLCSNEAGTRALVPFYATGTHHWHCPCDLQHHGTGLAGWTPPLF